MAGKRAGLDGERSGLFMEQIRLIKEMREHDRLSKLHRGSDEPIRPRYMVWENVPGAFSSNKGEDFRVVLEEVARIVEEGVSIPRPEKGKWSNAGVILGDNYSIAWRVFDAQYWGVPQRRKRICLVADFNGHSAAEIVFNEAKQYRCTNGGDSKSSFRDIGAESRSEVQPVCEGLPGDTEQSTEERKEASSYAAGSIGTGHPVFTYQDREECAGGGKGFLLQEDRSASLRTNNFQTVFQPVETVALEGNGQRPSHMGDGYSVSDKSYTLNSTEVHGVAYAVDMGGGKSACDIIDDKYPTLCTTHYGEPAVVYDARGNGDGNIVPTMTGDHQNRITDYTGVVVSMDRETFNTGQNFAQKLGIREDGIQPTLVARGPGAVCYWDGSQIAGTLTANNADGSQRMPDKDNFNCVVERINCGETYCTEGTKALQLLWSAYGEEKVFEWGTSILERIQSAEVLQQRMHEGSIQEETTQRNILDDNTLPCKELVTEWIVRDMRKREECGCTSQGLESTKQQHRESPEIMQELPQQNPQTCKELFDMWEKCEGIWILRQALSEIKKMGKSIHCEQRKIRYIVRRLTPLECTRLQGYPDGWVDIDTFVDSKGKTRKVSDSHKYKALGNSIALPSWRWVLKRMCANYERPATMASLFDGISGFPWLWTQINGRNSVLWTSEIEDFPSEVCKRHFGNEAKGEIGDYETFL